MSYSTARRTVVDVVTGDGEPVATYLVERKQDATDEAERLAALQEAAGSRVGYSTLERVVVDVLVSETGERVATYRLEQEQDAIDEAARLSAVA